jgi:hypothetical protein
MSAGGWEALKIGMAILAILALLIGVSAVWTPALVP